YVDPRGLGQDRDLGQLAADHRDLVARVQPRTLHAILVHLVGKLLAPRYTKSELGEECGDPCEQTDAADAMFLSLAKKRVDQLLPGALTLGGGVDTDRADLRQVQTIEMQRAAADDLALVFSDHKIAHVLAEFRPRTRQEGAIAGVLGDQFIDR